MKIKPYLINVTLLLVSVFVLFIIAETGFRIILFGNANVFNNQRNPLLYAAPYSDDDYWRLHYRLSDKYVGGQIPVKNPKWINAFIYRNNFMHKYAPNINDRSPVLLYGDSFARCARGRCFEDFLNTDKTFSKDHYLLNYGVGGYGVGQIYSLFKNSVDHYQKPIVFISLMTLDLDRSILSIRGGPKPYFIIENNMLKLISPNQDDFLTDMKPRIISYFYRRILYSKFTKKYLPNQLVSYLKKEKYYKSKKIEINEKIILNIISELKARNLDYVFVIFHHGWTQGVGNLNNNAIDWRNTFLRRILDENNITYIWSKDIIMQDMKETGQPLQNYFLEDDGHPTTYLNKLLTEKMKQYIFKIDNLK